MFAFLKKRRIGGDIAYYGLQDWWLNSFTPKEQAYIVRRYQPLSTGDSNSLISGHISWSSQSAVRFLFCLSGWFNNPRDRHIAVRILEKPIELSKSYPKTVTGRLSKKDAENILDLHFLYNAIIRTCYPLRKSNPDALEKVIAACRDQIELGPLAAKAFRKEYEEDILPAHLGYYQLGVILEKQGKYEEAIALCEKGSKTKWRGGGWEGRIRSCRRKLEKGSQ